MPLFGKDKKDEPVQPTPSPARNSTSTSGSKHGLFSRRRGSSPDVSPPSSPARSSTRSSGLHNVLHRNKEDPSITSARQRVFQAEAAEREADRALASARAAVRDAREHVRNLEAEAAEE
ncbi:MAG: hypothetical protein FE78DRAFT_32800 [Acidomyces sp. 'richmondensis']|nr:MAG: hypothetical protein FE78DRAFT_32800 [Acidomyces sp. 'richmondensis']